MSGTGRILAGAVLMAAGAGLLFAMVCRFIEPGFVESFLAYGASLVGFTMAAAGVAARVRTRRPSDR